MAFPLSFGTPPVWRPNRTGALISAPCNYLNVTEQPGSVDFLGELLGRAWVGLMGSHGSRVLLAVCALTFLWRVASAVRQGREASSYRAESAAKNKRKKELTTGTDNK